MTDETSTITVKTDQAISLPVSREERRIAIRYLDWKRCKKRLVKIRQPISRLQLTFPFCFGLSVSSVFALATLYLIPEVKFPAWSFPFYWLLLVFSLAVGICFLYLDYKIRKDKESDIDEVIEDMESIEKSFT